MKKLLSFLFLPFVCGVCYGESMDFVTVLSSPVGSFNKLEAVDSQTPAKGVTVNFCTQVGTSGTVELKGTDNAKLNRLNIGNNTTLGRTGAGKYSLGRITLAPGGDLMGGRLLGEVVTVNSGTAGRAKNVYGTGLTVKGAGADKLTVGTGSNVESKIENKAISDPGMVWSNEYQTDTACKGKAVSCANQYLLKQSGRPRSCDESKKTDGEGFRADCSPRKGYIEYVWSDVACDYIIAEDHCYTPSVCDWQKSETKQCTTSDSNVKNCYDGSGDWIYPSACMTPTAVRSLYPFIASQLSNYLDKSGMSCEQDRVGELRRDDASFRIAKISETEYRAKIDIYVCSCRE